MNLLNTPQIEIKVTGSGTSEHVANALRSIADSLELGDHVVKLNGTGKCNWEGPTLMTVITEGNIVVDDEDDNDPNEGNISPDDVIKIANSIGHEVSAEEIKQVLELYPSEARNDPSGNWTEILEQCICTVKS